METLEPSGFMHGVPTRSWRCFCTERKQERIAAQSLEKLGESFLPLCTYRRKFMDRYKVITEALFPRYVFAKVPDEAIGIAKRLRGLKDVVRFGGIPALVDEETIRALKESLTDDYLDLTPKFQNGERVVILSGLWAGVDGTLDGDARSAILVASLLGRPQRVPVEYWNLDRAYA